MSEKIMCEDGSFEDEIHRYIGQTVTIFTTSGGQSGNGFTGVILSVNRSFVRLITRIGTAPQSPLGDTYNEYESYPGQGNNNKELSVGSVTDIPIDKISAFVHNAV